MNRLPTSFMIAPPMIAVGGVSVVLYGMVLFAVVSARRHAPAPPLMPERAVTYATITPPTTVHPASPQPANPAAPKLPIATAPLKPDASKPGPAKPASEPPNRVIARATPAPTVAPKAAVVEPRVESWGLLAVANLPDDCQLKPEGPRLLISIPGSLHVLSPQLHKFNAPRLLSTIKGDFTALVAVTGGIMPGTDPLPLADGQPPLPFTFQSAGLLAWVDEANYLRLERTSIYNTVEGKRYHHVLVENCRDGKLKSEFRDARDAALTLRFERRGSEMRCSYNPDGRNWLEVKRQNVGFPGELKVGVSASNLSTKPFSAHLEDFQITAGTPAGGKGS